MGIATDISAQLTFPGERNLGGDPYALMIEKFNGEVATLFQMASVTDGLFDWTTLVGTDTLSNAAMGDPELTKLEPGVSPAASQI
jgi:hypothetical protein